MRLLVHNNLLFLASALVVFVGGSVVFFWVLGAILDEEVTEELYRRKAGIESYLEMGGTLPDPRWLGMDHIVIGGDPALREAVLSDTAIYDPLAEENLPYRALSFPARVQGEITHIMVLEPKFESEDLLEAIQTSLMILFAVLVTLLLGLNLLVSRRTLRPFHDLLQQLEAFELSRQTQLRPSPTYIHEFKQLAATLQRMAERIGSDYRSMKEFTENASHELQTPLSVISSKLELLLQSPNIGAEEARHLNACHEAVRRLSRMNQSLLLLARIEHGQLGEGQTDLAALSESKLEALGEMMAFRELTVAREIVQGVRIPLPVPLAEILLNNLVTNAVRHTANRGRLTLEVRPGVLRVCNTGAPLGIPAGDLFKRFQKADPNSESTGLGLAIVKQICDTYNLRVQYGYEGQSHCFTVRF